MPEILQGIYSNLKKFLFGNARAPSWKILNKIDGKLKDYFQGVNFGNYEGGIILRITKLDLWKIL